MRLSLRVKPRCLLGYDGDAVVLILAVSLELPLRLLGVLLHEPGRWPEYPISEPEGLGEALPAGETQVFVHLVDEAHIAPGEPVYGLPVVTDQEVGKFRLFHCLCQVHPTVGDVLELVNEDVTERVLPPAFPDCQGRSQNVPVGRRNRVPPAR